MAATKLRESYSPRAPKRTRPAPPLGGATVCAYAKTYCEYSLRPEMLQCPQSGRHCSISRSDTFNSIHDHRLSIDDRESQIKGQITKEIYIQHPITLMNKVQMNMVNICTVHDTKYKISIHINITIFLFS